ncbi:hemolysin family protein [Flavobacteriaceae bacterium]|jgi:putative hemolysin|nr:hemolysin family protein [Flavobacteriaceae bacterium]MDC1285627.1 hemolysin family protein [Flavobacteriaceae bacterium]|tara:strand:+ start:401 stop:1669 length:1269 start_codon:yes stop_codon:yes gene_type:complete
MVVTDFVIIICLMLSAFFSGMEIAFISSDRIFLEIEKNQGNIVARILTRITETPSKFIAAMLVGNNISLVVYGIFMGDRIISLLYPEANGANLSISILFYQTLISTVIILLTAEFLPKVFFQLYANKLIKFFIIPAAAFYYIFYPITFFVIKITDGLLRLFFKTSAEVAEISFSKGELGDYIEKQVESVTDKEKLDSEIQIFQNALEFSDLKAREVMVPRAELVALDIDKDIQELKELFMTTGLSKIPVYQNSVDDILGYVHAFELLKKPTSIRSILLPVEFIHEPLPINEVLNRLTRKRKSLAVVLDEYGGTSGIITVEDIVEELFGEIEDEHDQVDHYELKVSDTEFEFSARLEVDYLNTTYGFSFPEEEFYETLGGLIVHLTEEIPQQGDVFSLAQYEFKILEVSSTKIERIHLRVKES